MVAVSDGGITTTLALVTPEKADIAEFSSQSIRQSEAAEDLTIRQVAPLVLVLTGATFLNVRLSPFILS